MKAIIVIEIDENHLLKEMNELYDRLYGYKCELKPMPERKEENLPDTSIPWTRAEIMAYTHGIARGWNDCVEDLGEAE